ncbi:hypothetical protein LINGRAHAP2_LOCUS18468 [Linum grandiflorum]
MDHKLTMKMIITMIALFLISPTISTREVSPSPSPTISTEEVSSSPSPSISTEEVSPSSSPTISTEEVSSSPSPTISREASPSPSTAPHYFETLENLMCAHYDPKATPDSIKNDPAIKEICEATKKPTECLNFLGNSPKAKPVYAINEDVSNLRRFLMQASEEISKNPPAEVKSNFETCTKNFNEVGKRLLDVEMACKRGLITVTIYVHATFYIPVTIYIPATFYITVTFYITATPDSIKNDPTIKDICETTKKPTKCLDFLGNSPKANPVYAVNEDVSNLRKFLMQASGEISKNPPAEVKSSFGTCTQNFNEVGKRLLDVEMACKVCTQHKGKCPAEEVTKITSALDSGLSDLGLCDKALDATVSSLTKFVKDVNLGATESINQILEFDHDMIHDRDDFRIQAITSNQNKKSVAKIDRQFKQHDKTTPYPIAFMEHFQVHKQNQLMLKD